MASLLLGSPCTVAQRQYNCPGVAAAARRSVVRSAVRVLGPAVGGANGEPNAHEVSFRTAPGSTGVLRSICPTGRRSSLGVGGGRAGISKEPPRSVLPTTVSGCSRFPCRVPLADEEDDQVKKSHHGHVPSPPLPHEGVRTPKPDFATERRHPAPGKTPNSHQNRHPDRRIGPAVHSQRAKGPLTRGNMCPKWDSTRTPALENTGLPGKHTESGPVRPMYDPIRSPRCGHCPHPRCCLPEALPKTAAPRTDRVRRLFAVNDPIPPE